MGGVESTDCHLRQIAAAAERQLRIAAKTTASFGCAHTLFFFFPLVCPVNFGSEEMHENRESISMALIKVCIYGS